jgi:hypothetical protein
MGHLSGSFSSAFAGKLSVTLEGTFTTSTSRDAGFPSGNANMLYRATVNGVAMPGLERTTPTVTSEFDYPGGSVSWALATERVQTAYNGTIGSVGFTNLRLTCVLKKK